MTMRLTAGAVDVGELADLETFQVSFAEDPDGSGWALIVERALEFAPEDAANGMDTYALTSHEGITHYGGVTRWSRAGRAFEFALDATAANELGLEEQFTVIVADEQTAQTVDDGLRRALG